VTRITVRLLCLALPLLASSVVIGQTEFSGEIVNTGHQGAHSAKIFFGKDKLRIEGQDPNGRGGGVVIVNMANHTSLVLMPQQHMYMEMPQEQSMRQNMDLFHVEDVDNACSQWLQQARNKGGSCHKVGNETVNGRSTVKYEGTNAKGESARVWIDPNLRFPVKWEGANQESGEMRNIQEGSQPASLFEVPAGYTKMDIGSMMQRRPN
jgi:hypothetical protein